MAIDLGDIPSGTEPTTAEKLQIRSAIGVGTTDAPTFLGVNINASGAVPESGMAWNSSAHLAFYHNSTIRMVVLSTGTTIGSDMAYSWGSAGIPTSASRDLILARDAAGILAQRNGTSAQAFRVYNAYHGTTADEWLEIDWKTTGGTVKIGANKGATGGARALALSIEGTPVFGLSATSGASTAWWSITRAGHLLCATDNTYDIGAIGANRPRHVNVAGSIRAQYSGLTTAAGVTMAYFQAQALGVVSLTDNSGYDFVRLQIGGPLDTYPAIARDGAGIKFTGAAAGSTSWIKVPAVAVASLPLAATAGVGARSFVNDALSPVFGSAVTGGGAVTVPVYSTGSAWNVG